MSLVPNKCSKCVRILLLWVSFFLVTSRGVCWSMFIVGQVEVKLSHFLTFSFSLHYRAFELQL